MRERRHLLRLRLVFFREHHLEIELAVVHRAEGAQTPNHRGQLEPLGRVADPLERPLRRRIDARWRVNTNRIKAITEVQYSLLSACAELLKEYEAQNQLTVRGFLEQELGMEIVEKILAPQNLMALGHK